MNNETIRKMVKASGVCAGELVLIHFWGENSELEIANGFLSAVASLGASPVLLQQSRTRNREIFIVADEQCFDERYFDLFSNADAVLDVFAYRPVVLGYELEPKQFDYYRRYMSQIFRKLMTCKRFMQIRIPTAANAEESGLEPQDYIDRMMSAYDIDYEAVEIACKQKIERFDSVNHITVHTGNGHSLQFDLTGRTWHVDAGDGDLPCGEVYIAPVESATHGELFFETLHVEDLGEFNKVLLTVENGKVISSNHADMTEYLDALSGAERTIGELGLGMNPNVKDLCGYTPLDEKMGGTFHVAIGANTMFGGMNDAPIHVDFVGVGEVDFQDEERS